MGKSSQLTREDILSRVIGRNAQDFEHYLARFTHITASNMSDLARTAIRWTGEIERIPENIRPHVNFRSWLCDELDYGSRGLFMLKHGRTFYLVDIQGICGATE